jgi:hypothetical protein
MAGSARGWEWAGVVARIHSLPYISFMVRAIFRPEK